MSRARGWRKLTVEESLSLDAVDLRQAGVFSSAFGTSFTCRWRRPISSSDCAVEGKVLELPGLAMGLLISYEVSQGRSLVKLSMEYVIRVTTTRCRYGGRRYWLLCPFVQNGVPCGRRSVKLYLPPGGTKFTCRQCGGLTYRSCQDADKRVYLLARSPERLRMALQIGTIRQQLLAVSAVTLLIKRANRRRAPRKSSRSDFIQRGQYATQA